MLRNRRDARQEASTQNHRYVQASGRSRYRNQSLGDSPEQYDLPREKYEHPQQQQYNQPQQYGQQYRSSQPQWLQRPSGPRQMYGLPQQHEGQQPTAFLLNEPYLSNEVSAQQSQVIASPQRLQLPQQSSKSRPCVIPQIIHKRFSGENMSPFVRVCVPELEHKISSYELIVFIDELNEAFLANPALQVANNVANVGGMAPSMIVQMISMGVNVVAGVSSSVTTKVRTKKYLAKASQELFHPRGLHVQTCRTDKMLQYAGLGDQENVFIRQQYKNEFENAQQVQADGSIGPSKTSNDPITQRMSSLGNRVMSLSFDNVEEVIMPDGLWKKWGVKEASKAEQKQTKNFIRDQAKETGRSRRIRGRGPSRRQERQEEKKAKEANKILWIVITTKEQSAGGDDEWDSELESSESHKY